MKFFRNSNSMVSLLYSFGFFTLLLLFFIGPMVYKKSAVEINYKNILAPPSRKALFGTDSLGRDVLSRVLYGGRISIMVGAGVVLITTVAGVIIGLIAGYLRKLDEPLMRIMDIFMAFPSLILALAILSVLEKSVLNIVIALSLVYTPRSVRIVRGVVLSLREETYVEAARSVGCSEWRIMFKHILPGVLPSVVIQEMFLFAYAVLAEAGLSFVCIGIQPPTPSLGNIIREGSQVMREAPWLAFFSGAVIIIIVLLLNLLGDNLRERLDPKRKHFLRYR